MVATTNYPGSSNFDYFVGTKAECQKWLDKKEEEYLAMGYPITSICPLGLTSNKEAAKWRYRDGKKVVNF